MHGRGCQRPGGGALQACAFGAPPAARCPLGLAPGCLSDAPAARSTPGQDARPAAPTARGSRRAGAPARPLVFLTRTPSRRCNVPLPQWAHPFPRGRPVPLAGPGPAEEGGGALRGGWRAAPPGGAGEGRPAGPAPPCPVRARAGGPVIPAEPALAPRAAPARAGSPALPAAPTRARRA